MTTGAAPAARPGRVHSDLGGGEPAVIGALHTRAKPSTAGSHRRWTFAANPPASCVIYTFNRSVEAFGPLATRLPATQHAETRTGLPYPRSHATGRVWGWQFPNRYWLTKHRQTTTHGSEADQLPAPVAPSSYSMRVSLAICPRVESAPPGCRRVKRIDTLWAATQPAGRQNRSPAPCQPAIRRLLLSTCHTTALAGASLWIRGERLETRFWTRRQGTTE